MQATLGKAVCDHFRRVYVEAACLLNPLLIPGCRARVLESTTTTHGAFRPNTEHVRPASRGPGAPCSQTAQVVQYINFIKSDDEPQSHGDSFTTSGGDQFPWLQADQFESDYPAGHGTHVAGSVAGATLNNPAELATCEPGEVVSCVGGCVADTPATDDDLVSASEQAIDIDRLCPLFSTLVDCDDSPFPCLSENISETLTENGGMAQGAKLAIFDAIYDDVGFAFYIGNGLWEPCAEAGCKLHTNSWGGDFECQHGPTDILYDEFMYEVGQPGVWCWLSC